MYPHRLLLTGLIALAVTAVPAQAATTTCGIQQAPLLDVVATTTATVPRPPYPTQIGQTLGFIYRNNQAAVSQISTVVVGGLTTDSAAKMICGNGPTALWSALTAKLNAIQPGFAKSCFVTNSAPFGVRYTVVWHGKGARKNSFVLDAANDSLPPCDAKMLDFLNALAPYLSFVQPVDTFGKLP